MNATKKSSITVVLRNVSEFAVLATAAASVPLVVYIDSVVLGDGGSERSITEIVQETLLLLAAVVFFVAAIRHPESRGFFVLVGGFFAAMLVRELDFLFDVIHHGAWFYAAILTTVASIAVALVNRDTVFGPMVAYLGSKSWIYVTIGLLIVFVLSRLFGSGRLIWNAVMNGDYRAEYKAIIQEGLELFGYVFIFYGAWLLPERP
jgi:hypothetical protein